jgi:hypothetical protein
MYKSIPTTTLLKKLFAAHSIKTFVKDYGEHMDSPGLFHEYLHRLCREKEVIPAHVIARSGIDRVFGHQIFSGVRTASRDKALLLAFAFGLDYDGTQALLRAAGKRALHPKSKRDAVVIFALKRKLDMDGVQTILFDLSLPILGEKRND